MQILVSFCNLRTTGLPSLGLLDPVTLEFRVLCLPAELARCRGITGLSACAHSLYVVAQDMPQLGENRFPAQSALFILDRDNLAVRNRYAFRSAADVHSLCCQGDAIYAVSTGTDEIIRLQTRGSSVISEVTHWRPDPAAPRQDIHHLNAVIGKNDDLLVAGFGKKDGDLWGTARDGFIVNITRNEILASHLDQPHSLVHTEFGVVYCESRRKSIRVVGNRQHQFLPGYTRGVCKVGQAIYVATSIGRRISKSTGKINNPAERGAMQGNCTISRLSLDDFSIADTLALDEYASEVYDLLPVEGLKNCPVVSGTDWRRSAIVELAAALDDRTSWAQRLREESAERADQLVQKEKELQALSVQNSTTTRFIEDVAGRLSSLHDISAQHSRQIEQVKNALDEASARHSRQVAQLGSALDEAAARTSREIAQFRNALELSDFARSAGPEPWTPEVTRAFEYQKLVHRVIDAARAILPADARALVVSKGDSHLLRLNPGTQTAWHFPRTTGGAYAGNNPSCSIAAIAHLEALRAQGASHLVFPSITLWWLEYYVGFQRHLKQRYPEIFRQDDTCVIYALTECKTPDRTNSESSLRDVVLRCRERLGDDVAMLDWNAGVDWHGEFPDLSVFRPPGEASALPYFDRSIDVVAIRPGNSDRYTEARRVASGALLTLSEPAEASPGESRASIEWLKDGVERERVAPRVTIVVDESAAVGDSEPLMSALRASLPCDFRGEIIAARSAWHESATAVSGGHDVLVFFHGQIVPLADWLPPLLASFQRTRQAGIAAGRLVWGDGRLHSAGGVIFADGSLAGFGAGDYEPEAPLFEFVRQVDCCVGPFLATRRSLFDELQGFDPAFQSCDFKFADYCLRARELGFLTIYQPETQIACLSTPKPANEPRGGETVARNGDAQLFREKWLLKLRRQPVPPRFFDREAWHALAANGAWKGAPQS